MRRLAASALALLTAISIWLSAGSLAITQSVLEGDTNRIALLPPIWLLGLLAVAAAAAAAIANPRLDRIWPLAISVMLWLPFVPGPIPDAFLIWQGPLEVLIWLLVIAGLVAARGLKLPALVVDETRAPWIAAVLVAASAAVVFNQVRGVVPGGDEPHYLAATQSLLNDADLAVANNYAQGDYLDYFPGQLQPHYLVRGVGGEIYSIHAPGVSVIILPAFAIAGYAGSVMMIALIAGLCAALTWTLAFRMSGDATAAWVGVAAVFLTTPYVFHTFAIYPEVIGSLCVIAGLWLLFELAEGREAGTRALVVVGSALAILPWLHSRFAVLAGILGLLIAARLVGRSRAVQRIAVFLSVPIVAGGAWFAFFYLLWGTPSPMAPYGADTSTSAAYIARGLIGMVVDQQFGILTTAPIYGAALIGGVLVFRQRPRFAIELLLVIVPYALTAASYAMWWAGSAAPGRFVISVLPVAALPIAVAWKQHRSAFVTVLLLASIALVLPRAVVESGRFIINNRGGIDGTLGWLSAIVDLPFAFPSVHRDGGSDAIRDFTVFFALLVVAAVVAFRVGKRAGAGEWTVSAIAFAAAVTIGIGMVGSAQGVPMLTPDRSKLAAVAAYRAGFHETVVSLDEARGLGEREFFAAMAIDISAPAARLHRVPAGEYDVTVTAPPSSPGALTMSVGRNDPPIEAPQLDDLSDGRSQFRLRLPVAAQTLNLAAQAQVLGARWLTIKPVAARPAAVARNALRATRYGHARVFFFDDWAYLERDGFWTRADGTATVVIDSDEGTKASGLPVSVTAGAVPTTVHLSVGGWEESLLLQAGQKQDLMLPPPVDGSWTLRIRSGNGFRPSAREPGNRDVRKLAAWITVH